MRQAAKTDANQGLIVNALRKAGASVQSLAAVGKGCPDLLVGYQGINYLMEVKDGNKVPSAQKLNIEQEHWHSVWIGAVHVVKSENDALKILQDKNDLQT
jgi:Holliday junction resolvase